MTSTFKKNIGIIILCRMGSKRLKGKTLAYIGGQTILSHIINRIEKSNSPYEIVVATSDHHDDKPIFDYCLRNNILCFRGNLYNVSNRLISCAERFNFENVVRINGDRLFLDYNVLRSMLSIFETSNYDLVTNINGSFPAGVSVEIFNVQKLKTLLEKNTSKHHEEHVTTILYDNISKLKSYVFKNTIEPDAAGYQLAIDTPKDLEHAKQIFNEVKSRFNLITFEETYMISKNIKEKCVWDISDRPYLIAEIGGNHEGDFEYAMELVDLAIQSDVDCIKLQIYEGNKLVSGTESASRQNHFKKFELTPEQHVKLAKRCIENNIDYLASVWDIESLNYIDPYLKFYKIGSGDLTAWPILKEIALRGKPIILSTGLSTLDEIINTVKYIQGVNKIYKSKNYLCVMQCTSMYPINEKEAQVGTLDVFKNTFNATLGYSDHTEAMLAIEVATSMGAKVIEFHFTDAREDRIFRDHKVSLVPTEISYLSQRLKNIYQIIGNGIKTPQLSEISEDHTTSFRRAVYCNRDLQEGDIIKEEDLVLLRPNHGVDARDFRLVVGAKTLKPVQAYSALYMNSNITLNSNALYD